MNESFIVPSIACGMLLSLALLAAPCSGKTGQADLHRADFRVEGASCVTCLRRIASELRGARGVVKADVSIYRPYWSIVIYDRKQTNIEQLKEAIKKENVRLSELEDKPIPEVPVVIIPKGMSQGAGKHD